MGMKRRDFIASTSAVLGSSTVIYAKQRTKEKSSKTGGGFNKMRTRKNVNSLEAVDDIKSYRKAVGIMKELSKSNPKDPRNWQNQAFIHGNCDGFQKCKHGSWFFAPWHRAYLFYFEELIRKYSGNENFALPYWDWTTYPKVPNVFYGANNPLADTSTIKDSCSGAPGPGRGRKKGETIRETDRDRFTGPERIKQIQENPDFYSYAGGRRGAGGALERSPHNFIHRWVGGETKFSNMVQAYSPLDPIFWLHHCNIDRLYSNWLSRPGHHPPSDGRWLDRSFNDFFDRDGNPTGSTFTCKEMLDSRVMNYRYDREVSLPQSILSVAMGENQADWQVLDSANAAPLQTNADRVVFETQGSPGTSIAQNIHAVSAGISQRLVRMRIEGLKTPHNQNTAVHVFINNTNPNLSDLSDSPGYVASLTFFNGHLSETGNHGHGHDHSSGFVLLNASEAFQNLYGQGNYPQDQPIKVVFLTTPLFENSERVTNAAEIQPKGVTLEIVEQRG